MTTGRVLCALAALMLASSVLLGVLPNPGTAVIVADAPLEVNCGTVFVETEYSGDDGCEGTVIGRMGLMVLLWLAALPTGAAGLLVVWRTVRRDDGLTARRTR